jgi:hypothetical protein
MKHNKTTTGDMAFDGMVNGNSGGYNSKYQKNQYTGHMNDGRLVNVGRGPTKVGNGSTGVSGKQPPKAAHGKEQKRNPGGITALPDCGCDSINVGRGPTRGVAQ